MTTDDVTVPPPPAVPGELIERVAQVLFDIFGSRSGSDVPRAGHRLHARQILAALNIGGIVEAARRDALTEAAEAIGSLAGRFHTPNWNDALNEAGRVLTDLIDDATPEPRSAP